MQTARILTVLALIAAQFSALAPVRASEQSSANAQLTVSAPAELCELAATERHRLSESQIIRIFSQLFKTASIPSAGSLGVRFGRQPAGALLDSFGTRFLMAPSVRARCCVLLV